MKMLLKPHGQFPADFLIKSLLENNEKYCWSLLGCLPQVSLLHPYEQIMESAPGASRAASLRFLLRKRVKLLPRLQHCAPVC